MLWNVRSCKEVSLKEGKALKCNCGENVILGKGLFQGGTNQLFWYSGGGDKFPMACL